ncbi:methyltransferase, FkbM family [Lysobacter sp. yr284]|uniref:FkbM family methyltransferase n=1 Tax=Lysobacter sp. yr284 TaxID=1761791 RepID=UPI0008953A04|nr:FkbM family methyltransferase [Lysobacter sp. yr284]SDZ01785.1 methyltransferase, FkbM family [Lysobacter sp. yr284]
MSTPQPTAHVPLPNGLTLYLQSAHMRAAAEYVVDEIFVEKQYQREGFEIGHADTVVDIGANMGVFALWASPQAPAGRVISVEPVQEMMDCLRSNLDANRIRNVSAVQAAVGPSGQKIELTYYPGFNIISHRSDFRRPAYARLKMYLKNWRVWRAPERVRAACISVGELLDEHGVDRVDLLKIDCEGGEYEIVRGMSERDWSRIDRIVMEFHEYHKDQRHEQLVELLRNRGFEVEVEKDAMTYRLMRFGTLWARRAH